MPAKLCLSIGLLAALLACGAPAAAAPGDPDAGFDGDGFALFDLGRGFERAAAVALDPDGRIVVGGMSSEGAEDVPFLARFLPDGSRDPSFGSGGIGTIALPCGESSPINDVHVLPDGKILAAGGCDGDFALLRFNSDGTLDQSFDGDPGNPGGGNGVVRTDFAGVKASALALAVDPDDGAIILAGICCTGVAPSYQDTTLARYHADGRLDTAFDGGPENVAPGDGRVIYELGKNGDDWAQGAIATGGGAALAGFANNNLYVGRIDAKGVPVAAFAGDGFAEIDHGPSDLSPAFAADGAGRFVVASEGGLVAPDSQLVFSRVDASGAKDATFATHTLNPTPEASDSAAAVLVQPDGGVLVVGSGYVSPEGIFYKPGRIVIARLHEDGSPDLSFGAGGVVAASGPQGAASAYDAVLDAEGRVVVAGAAFHHPVTGFSPEDVLVGRFRMRDEAAPQPSAGSFRLGRVRRNRRRGTATLFVNVPGPGRLVLAKTRKLKGAKKRARAAGRVGLPIRLRGKAKRRLAAGAAGKGVGRLRVKARVTFVPDGGSPVTRSKRFALVKR